MLDDSVSRWVLRACIAVIVECEHFTYYKHFIRSTIDKDGNWPLDVLQKKGIDLLISVWPSRVNDGHLLFFF